jgi:hypothetical protein
MTKRLFAVTFSIIILTSCTSLHHSTLDNTPDFISCDESLYFDRDNYVLICVNPERREYDIAAYKERGIDAIAPKYRTWASENTETCSPPVLLDFPSPRYPDVSKIAGYEGRIFVEVFIDTVGIVKFARFIEFVTFKELKEREREGIAPYEACEEGRDLDKPLKEGEELLVIAALEAAIRTTFKPPFDGKGKAIAVFIRIPIDFKLID